MKTEDLIRELENVEKKNKGRKYNTFEVCIDQMAHDCVQGLKALVEENTRLQADLSRYQTAEALLGKPVYYIANLIGITEDRINCIYIEDGLEGARVEGLKATFKYDDIGKTVFLTRESAEAALAEKGESNEH